MKVSVIAAVYKDVEALRLIVESLERQSYKNFELIVAEDDNSIEVKKFVKTIDKIQIKHVYQEDVGIRKARAQNNAIIDSSGDYLIFIDGDCIPFSTFIEGHVALAEKNHVLSGRRIEPGPSISSRLRNKSLSIHTLENNMLWYYFFIWLDSGYRGEEGFYFKPYGIVYKRILRKLNRSLNLLGCNFSCYKKDIIAINGFDESYEGTALSDDTDLQWRFASYGLKFKSCRNVANQLHLYHTREHRNVDYSKELELMLKRREEGIFHCEKGLNNH